MFLRVNKKVPEAEPAVAAQPDKSTTVTWSYKDMNETLSDEMASFLEEGFTKFQKEGIRHLDLPGGHDFVDFKRMYMATWKNPFERQYLNRVMRC